jgi:hypothetical protein
MSETINAVAVLDYEIATIPISTEDFGPQRAQDVEHLRRVRAALLEVVAAGMEAERDAFVKQGEPEIICVPSAEWKILITAIYGLGELDPGTPTYESGYKRWLGGLCF